jgi:uncharacterized protein YsxB (DUF464 family)
LVHVHIRKDSRERLSSFLATGHAGWAESGEDVVCAAVSTMLQAAWLGLSEISKIDVRATRQNGRLELLWPPDSRDDPGVHAIVATAALSVERIAAQYPEHVGVIHERDDG